MSESIFDKHMREYRPTNRRHFKKTRNGTNPEDNSFESVISLVIGYVNISIF